MLSLHLLLVSFLDFSIRLSLSIIFTNKLVVLKSAPTTKKPFFFSCCPFFPKNISSIELLSVPSVYIVFNFIFPLFFFFYIPLHILWAHQIDQKKKANEIETAWMHKRCILFVDDSAEKRNYEKKEREKHKTESVGSPFFEYHISTFQ